MSGSKIKNLTIAALLLLNTFFLIMIIIDRAADAREERQAIEDVCSILRSNGLHITPGNINAGGNLRTMRTVRVSEAEAAIAEAFLGEFTMTDQGVIYLYENEERGTAEFAGDFEIRLNAGVITGSEGALRAVLDLLRDMGIETSEPVISGPPGFETITAVCMYGGAEIFNVSVEFAFFDGYLETVSGRYVTGIEVAEDSSRISSVATALLDFLAAVLSGENESTRIYNIVAGYQHRVVGPSGEGVLSPAWLVITDTGRYIVDDATGEVR